MKTDYHCHILPGLDDGAKDIEEALYLSNQLIRWGFKRAICTPHIAFRYRNTPDIIREAYNKLNEALQSNRIALEIVASAEYRLIPETWREVIANDWLLPWDEKYILLELPIRSKEQLGEIIPLQEIKRIKSYGYIPVIAHPERYAYLQDEEINEFCQAGAILQINYTSLAGKYGENVRKKALELLSLEHENLYGTDLHSKEYVDSLDDYFKEEDSTKAIMS